MKMNTQNQDMQKILTGQEAAKWYNRQYGTSWVIEEMGGASTSTFLNKRFKTANPISVLENGSYYWLASAYGPRNLYYITPRSTLDQ